MEVFAVSELNRMVKAVLESVPELENVYVRRSEEHTSELQSPA